MAKMKMQSIIWDIFRRYKKRRCTCTVCGFVTILRRDGKYNTLSSIVEEIELHRGHKENRSLSPRDMWDWEPHEFTESVQEHTQEPDLEVLDRSQI